MAYEDSQDVRRDPPAREPERHEHWAHRSISHLDFSPTPSLLVPSDFPSLIHRAVSSLPASWRCGPHASGPIPLPVFVRPPPGMGALPWEEVAERLITSEGVNSDRIEGVRLARETWDRRPSFRLPLRVLAIGRLARDVLAELKTASWYVESPEARSHGIQIDFATPEIAGRALWRQARDIVVVDRDSVPGVLAAARRIRDPKRSRPRLVVFLDQEAGSPYGATRSLPPGMAMLWLQADPGPAAAFLKAFIYGIIHDYPLHEANKAAMRGEGERLHKPARLSADPASNQALRMADALDQLQAQAFALETMIDPGEPEDFLDRLDAATADKLRPYLKSARSPKTRLKRVAAERRKLQVFFQQETMGLRPMAEAEAELTAADSTHQAMREILAAVSDDPDLMEKVRRAQDRRVDVALDRFVEDAFYRPLADRELRSPLSCDQCYRLRIHIGHRLRDSLMTGAAPPIDPLLPDPEGREGHHLEVAVFESDFTLLSPRVQLLYLPLLGGSEPVYFVIRAPKWTGKATLRIGIYHQNHLLQAFRFEAQLARESIPVMDEQQVMVHLDMARIDRFADLDNLRQRCLAIGVNKNEDGRTHSLMLKKDEVADPIRLSEALIRKSTEAFRKLLERESLRNGNSRFDNDAVPGTPPSEDFAPVIRKLAHFGGDLYREIMTSRASKAMKAKLRALAKEPAAAASAGTIIQVIRLDPNFAFPWSILYDYRLPTRVHGAAPHPICMGRPLDGGATGATDSTRRKGCPHNPHREVYCIEGFWGVRHQIEQLIAQRNAPHEVRCSAGGPGILLVRGIDNRFTRDLAQKLKHMLKTAPVELKPDDPHLLDLLWEPDKRPPLVVVIGHMATRDFPGEPVGPRIITFPKDNWKKTTPIPNEKWLREQLIFEYESEAGSWEEQPRSVVFLIACDSAATEIASLNDFVKSFTSAGAGALIGTECTIFSSLGARFIREVAVDLMSGSSSLGAALQAFNQRLLASGNPMAFAFSCFGNADLHLAL